MFYGRKSVNHEELTLTIVCLNILKNLEIFQQNKHVDEIRLGTEKDLRRR